MANQNMEVGGAVQRGLTLLQKGKLLGSGATGPNIQLGDDGRDERDRDPHRSAPTVLGHIATQETIG